MRQIILVRHGQSVWNKLNKFCGWSNIPLTTKGIVDLKILQNL